MRGPIPGSDCQPVAIVVPLHTHHCSLVGMVKGLCESETELSCYPARISLHSSQL